MNGIPIDFKVVGSTKKKEEGDRASVILPVQPFI
jgi:hypothetical protein